MVVVCCVALFDNDVVSCDVMLVCMGVDCMIVVGSDVVICCAVVVSCDVIVVCCVLVVFGC